MMDLFHKTQLTFSKSVQMKKPYIIYRLTWIAWGWVHFKLIFFWGEQFLYEWMKNINIRFVLFLLLFSVFRGNKQINKI